VLKSREEVDYVDVSPKQLVSVAASLIPFSRTTTPTRVDGFEHAAPGRALIRGESSARRDRHGSVTARDSGAVVLCKREGIVDQVDSERIIVRVESITPAC